MNEVMQVVVGVAAWIALCIGSCVFMYVACILSGKEDGRDR